MNCIEGPYVCPILIAIICLTCRKWFVHTSCEIFSINPTLNEALNNSSDTNDSTSTQKKLVVIPFFLASSVQSDLFVDLVHIMNQYQADVDRMIKSLTASYHEAVRSEQLVFFPGDDKQHFLLSSAIELRISHIAQILESDGFVLEKLLQPFQVTFGLPSPNDSDSVEDFAYPALKGIDRMTQKDEYYSYDSGVQIIAHVTRDWTYLGRSIRKFCYEFFIVQLRMRTNSQSTVLIPGAGLGRLAKDLFQFGFHVEANEVSITMASAAFSLLHETAQGKIHPFAFDMLMNEVSSTDRYEDIAFPDNEMIYDIHMVPTAYFHGSLSYTVGDFVHTYSPRRRSKTFDSVVTCFFIDTATNIYEYILVIRHVLKDGGIWVNVGPLQWHTNSKLRPTVDELRLLIEAMGFAVKLWMVDKDPMNYRHFDDKNRHTKYEGYNPLRFVVQRIENNAHDIDAAQVIRDLRSAKRTTL